MPKFIATSGSFFRPYSYDELVKPIAHMQEAHNAAQEAYDTLDMQTSALRHYISDNPETDQRARAMYDNYMDKLSTLQNNLWEHGYTAQTKRDLSAAKSAYNSDIARLAQAIQNRQKRAEEFWEAKRKDPTLVQGKDPGAASLDEYLVDDNYGRNWFAYSGKDFEKEVGDEVKARAAGLLDDISKGKVVANPALPQTLTRILTQGVTNDEIALAGRLVDEIVGLDVEQRRAVYDGLKAKNQLSDGAELLSEALLSRLDATGIRGGDVSPEGWRSLINRGKAGWGQGVMAPVVKDFENPEFQLQMERRKADIDFENYKRKKALDKPTEGPTGGWQHKPGWNYFRGAETRKAEERLHNTFHKRYTDANGNTVPKRIVGHDGVEHWVSNGTEAAKYAFDTEARRLGMLVDPQDTENLDGLDVSLSVGRRERNQQISKNQKYIVKKENGKPVVRKYDATTGKAGDVDEAATRRYNDLLEIHKAEMEAFKANNPDFDIDKDTFSADDARELRRKYKGTLDLDNVDDDELELAIRRATIHDMWTQAAPLIGEGQQYDYEREELARALDAFLASSGEAGKNGKGSINMLFPVLEGNYDYDSNGVGKEKAFTFDSNGRINPKSIIEAVILPEDIAVGKDGEPMMRITTSVPVPNSRNKDSKQNVKNTYLVSLRAFGNLYDNLTQVYYPDPTSQTGEQVNLQQIFQWLSLPYQHPDSVLGLDDTSSDIWAERAGAFVNRNIVSAKDIVRDDDNWGNFYSLLNDLIMDITASELDWQNFYKRRRIGDTNEKATTYGGTRK